MPDQDIDEEAIILFIIDDMITSYLLQIFLCIFIGARHLSRKRKRSVRSRSYSMISRMPSQCSLLRELGGLSDGKWVSVEEQVALFLGILAHHKKNRIVGFDYRRSGQTISHYVHVVLKAIFKLHSIFLVKPDPVASDCTDPRWKWFKGCLGALDGTYINVKVPSEDKPRYRTRKGNISTNVLAVCDRNLKFVYVLPGWEGSANDSRVLRDAVSKVHGLRFPKVFRSRLHQIGRVSVFYTQFEGLLL